MKTNTIFRIILSGIFALFFATSCGEDKTVGVESPDDMQLTIRLAGGAEYCSTRTVPLQITVQGAVEMAISNIPFTGAESWVTYTGTVQWVLETGGGTKTVHVKVRNSKGMIVEDSASIKPVPLTVGLILDGGAKKTSLPFCYLTLNSPTAKEMRISNKPFDGSEQWMGFSEDVEWALTDGNGLKSVYVRVRDDFLVEQETYGEIEKVLPDLLVILAGGATHTKWRTVPLRIVSATAVDMQISNRRFTGGEAWMPYLDSLQWELETGAGTKRVYVKVRNAEMEEETAIATIEPLPITLSAVMAGGAKTTKTLNNLITINAPTGKLMRLANQPLTEDSLWQPFSSVVDWAVEPGPGLKKVWLEVMDDFGQTAATSVSIEPVIPKPTLKIVTSTGITSNRQVSLNVLTIGATEMALSNQPDSAGISWQTYRPYPGWDVGSDNGMKYVYAWFRNPFHTTTLAMDSIILDTICEVESFEWSSSRGDSLDYGDLLEFTLKMKPDAFGAETGGLAMLSVENWRPVTLYEEAEGVYRRKFAYTEEKPRVKYAEVKVVFTDRAGNKGEFIHPKQLNCDGSFPWKTLHAYSNSPASVRWKGDNSTLAVGGTWSVFLWSTTQWGVVKTVNSGYIYPNCLSYSHDNAYFAYGNKNRVSVVRGNTYSNYKVLDEQTNVRSLAYSHDDKVLATGYENRTIILWNVAEQTAIKTLKGANDFIYSLQFSPDDSLLAVGGSKAVLELWRYSDSTIIHSFEAEMAFRSVAFSPDGRDIAGAHRYLVTIWDVATGAERLVLSGHASYIYCISYRPDGLELATASADGTVRVWDTTTGECLRILKWGDFGMDSVAYSPDGKVLACGNSSGQVFLWK